MPTKYYIDPILPSAVTDAIRADVAAIRGPRTKDGTIKSAFHMKLTEADAKAFQTVEELAQKVAQVSASNVIRRAVRFYSAHLAKIAGDAGEMAVERRALQNIPTTVERK